MFNDIIFTHSYVGGSDCGGEEGKHEVLLEEKDQFDAKKGK